MSLSHSRFISSIVDAVPQCKSAQPTSRRENTPSVALRLSPAGAGVPPVLTPPLSNTIVINLLCSPLPEHDS